MVSVSDPFGVADDPAMPFLRGALDPDEVERLSFLSGMALQHIEVVRLKPGRRCLVEYCFRDGRGDETVLIGKARARSLDFAAFETTRALWESGFEVPEPVGVVPAFRMWLQRKVPGVVSTGLLLNEGSQDLSQKIARLAWKLHGSGVAARKRHTPDDEMNILSERLEGVRRDRQELSPRIGWVLDACRELAVDLPVVDGCGIHRDFYPDQVMVDGDRRYLLDLDLYAEGDPALDIGNFAGHLIEHSLRLTGEPNVLKHRENALVDEYCRLAGDELRWRIAVYTTLTLARHIWISTLFPDRRHNTVPLLSHCEDRLEARESHS